MSIARYARKERLPVGAQKEIALRLGVAQSVVSRVMNDKGADLAPATRRKVQVAIARRLGLKVAEAFPLLFTHVSKVESDGDELNTSIDVVEEAS